MKIFKARQMYLLFIVMLSVFSITGCGGGGSDGQAPVLGSGGAAIAPTVTAVTPLAGASGVPRNLKIISAAFSEPMSSGTLIADQSFRLVCGGTPVTGGTVTYLPLGNVATLRLLDSTTLPAITPCTATITTAATDTAGAHLAENYDWTFTTGATPDVSKPRVTLTVPATTTPGPTPGVPTNTAITAVFNEDMAPATINTPATSFTLTCPTCVTPPAGSVGYAVGSRIATFTPTAVLEAGKTYTATIKGTGANPATDVATNALAGDSALPLVANDYVWTFTTAAAVPAASVSVLSTNPGPAATVCSNSSINATFTVPSGLRMDPLTLTTSTFTVTGPALAPVTAASVLLDAPTGTIATFIPLAPLTPGVVYTATIKSGAAGVKDTAIPANTMLTDYSWTFTAGAVTANCPRPVVLGAAAPFGFLSSAALTNEGSATVITGDAATTSAKASIVEFHDSVSYGEVTDFTSGGLVTGTIYASDAPNPVDGTAAVVAAAALAAYTDLAPAARPGGMDVTTNSLVNSPGNLPGELGGRTLAPGVYFSTPGTYGISGVGHTADGDLTLDAQGNANAIWVFQAPGGLTVGVTGPAVPAPPVQVLLINGAQAKNVFWYVPAGAIINTGATMVGTIISSASTTFSTAGAATSNLTTLNGRALVLAAGATMVNTVINVPAP